MSGGSGEIPSLTTSSTAWCLMHAASFMLSKGRKSGSISERSSRLDRLLFDRVCRVAMFTWLLGIVLICVLASPFHLYTPAAAVTRLFQRADSIKSNESISVSIDDTTTNEYTSTNATNTMQANQSVGALIYPKTTPPHWPSDEPFNPDTQVRNAFHCAFLHHVALLIYRWL